MHYPDYTIIALNEAKTEYVPYETDLYYKDAKDIAEGIKDRFPKIVPSIKMEIAIEANNHLLKKM